MKEETSASSTNQDVRDVEENPKKETKDFVSYDTHAKLLKQRKMDQERMRDLESRLTDFEAQQKQREEEALVEQQNWKKLADNYKTEVESVRKERDGLKGQITNAIKTNAFLSKLPGKIKRPEYRKFIPIDAIIIDPETGDVEENSLSQTVEQFMNEHGKHLVEIPGEKRKMPSAPLNRTEAVKGSGDIKNNLEQMLTKFHNKE